MKKLSCASCREALPLLLETEAVAGLPAAANPAVAEHLASCAECARDWQVQHAIRQTSRSIGETAAPAALRSSIRGALQSELNNSAEKSPGFWSAWLPSPRSWRLANTAWSGAALAAFALFLTMRTDQPSVFAPPAASPESANETSAPQSPAARSDAAAQDAAPQKKKTAPIAKARVAEDTTATPPAEQPATSGNSGQPAPQAAREASQPAPGVARLEDNQAPPSGTELRKLSRPAPTLPGMQPAKRAGAGASLPKAESAAPMPEEAKSAALGSRLQSRSRASERATVAAPALRAENRRAPGFNEETTANKTPPEADADATVRALPAAPAIAMAVPAAPSGAAAGDVGASAPEFEAPQAKLARSAKPVPAIRLTLLPRMSPQETAAAYPSLNVNEMLADGMRNDSSKQSDGAQGPSGPKGPAAPSGSLASSSPVSTPPTDKPGPKGDKGDKDDSGPPARGGGGFSPPAGVFGFRQPGGAARPAGRPERLATPRTAPPRTERPPEAVTRAGHGPGSTAETNGATANADLTAGRATSYMDSRTIQAMIATRDEGMDSPFALGAGAAPITAGELRRAVLNLMPSKDAAIARVCFYADGLEFPNSRDGVLWRGSVQDGKDLLLPVNLRATRAGNVRVRIVLETDDGTILSQGTVEMFVAP